MLHIFLDSIRDRSLNDILIKIYDRGKSGGEGGGGRKQIHGTRCGVINRQGIPSDPRK